MAARSLDLLVYSSDRRREFLGCLTCASTDRSSIFNRFGPYGSEYGPTSLFNRYSPYGAAYGRYSACNRYASDPPTVVDEDGGYYGRLTINAAHPAAITNDVFREALVEVTCLD